jgi:hypothetical protein
LPRWPVEPGDGQVRVTQRYGAFIAPAPVHSQGRFQVAGPAVGRKPELARLLIESAISGSSQAIPAEERGYVQAIRAATDAETKIAIYASAMRGIAGRLARCWSPERYEHFLADAWRRLLLAG